MGKCIIKIKDKYFEWSTVVDAPITYGMTIEQLNEHIKEEYGREGLLMLPERLDRVEESGTSFLGRTLEEVLSSNRAGEDEKNISESEIYEKYTQNKKQKKKAV